MFNEKVILTLKRLECVNEDLEGQFHREHHAPSNHVKLYSSDQVQRIKNIIDSLSLILKRNEFACSQTSTIRTQLTRSISRPLSTDGRCLSQKLVIEITFGIALNSSIILILIFNAKKYSYA